MRVRKFCSERILVVHQCLHARLAVRLGANFAVGIKVQAVDELRVVRIFGMGDILFLVKRLYNFTNYKR